MDAESAKKLIQDTFEGRFEKGRFVTLIKNLLNHVEESTFTYHGSYIPDAYKPCIQKLERLCKYLGPEGRKIDVLIVYLKKENSLERARTMQRNFIAWYLNGSRGGDLKDAALAAFVSPDQEDWRFSFIKMEYRLDKSGGKVRAKQEFTSARRYSYLVGQNENSHTAQSQLLPLLENDEKDPALEDLEDAFSVEKVTREFFEQYRNLFINVKEALDKVLTEHLRAKKDFKEKKIEPAGFAKKLLGQIVFLCFLQKKGWFGVGRDAGWGSGPKNFLRLLFKKEIGAYSNFFNDILEPLFYEALAIERPDDYYSKLNCKIPFLNGGLFDPTGDYDWIHTDILLPNELFSNSIENSKGDTGTGILDVFDRYNFTVREDEPLEKEVAVDPEMLGKVFENLLEVKDRKSKGTYYTPREIVHYMCRESLINYLDSELNYSPLVPAQTGQKKLFGKAEPEQAGLDIRERKEVVARGELETLIRFGETVAEHDSRVASHGKETKRYPYRLPEAVRLNARKLDGALEKIRVCDPAVGSGAFLVGMMGEIVRARKALTNHLNSSEDRSPYAFKRRAIHNCLYGVDIDPGAVEICKLRLWLSLVVDEEDITQIKPLPNLDYKIARGNSLLGVEKDLYNLRLFNELEELKPKYFDETNFERKRKYKEEIDSLISRITEGKKEFDFEVYFSEIFHEKNGFDVVIGNPPYVQIQKFSGEQIQKDLENQNYKTFAKTGDIYCLFYEKGNKILKVDGALTFITSNKWMRAKYGEKIRKYFLDDVMVHRLIDFGDSPIFEKAITYTNIMMFFKSKKDVQTHSWDVSNSYIPNSPLSVMLAEAGEGVGFFSEDSFVILPERLSRIKKRVEEAGTPIKSWGVSIYRGILTGFNEAFIIDGKKRDELITKDPKSADVIKPVLRGRDIKKYQAYAERWLINTHNGFKNSPPIIIDNYPAIKEHLDRYLQKLKKRQDKGTTPYNLRNCAYLEKFEKEKIVWLEMSPNPNFFFEDSAAYILNTAYMLTGSSLKYLLAVFNSSVLNVYFPMISTDIRGETKRYIKQYVEKLPIPKIPDASQRLFECIVDFILFLKQKEKKLSLAFFEQLIDGMVFEIYFKNEILTAKKEILRHLGEIKPIDGKMNEKKKLTVIQSEFDRLCEPSHPVRNNLETLDSIEEIKIIQDALG